MITKSTLSIGIVASPDNYAKHASGCAAIHIIGNELPEDIQALLLHIETEEEFEQLAAQGARVRSLLEACSQQSILSILYVPDFAPVVEANTISVSGNRFNDLSSLIQSVDYLLIGDEIYLVAAQKLKGDNCVYQIPPLFDSTICNPVNMCVDFSSPIDDLVYAASYFERFRHLPQVEQFLREMNQSLRDSKKTIKRYEQAADDVAKRISCIKQHTMQLGVNNHYYSSEYIPAYYCETYACGGLLLTNYTKAVNKYFFQSFIFCTAEDMMHQLTDYASRDLLRFKAENVITAYKRWSAPAWYQYLARILNYSNTQKNRWIHVVLDTQDKALCKYFEWQDYEFKHMVDVKNFTPQEIAKYDSDDMIVFFKKGMKYDIQYLSDFGCAAAYSQLGVLSKAHQDDALFYSTQNACVSLGSAAITVKEFCAHHTYLFNDSPESTHPCEHLQLTDFWLNEPVIESKEHKEIGVIIPIYNNGNLLYGRCFRSLLRSKVFDELQIYMIDDGSTDDTTVNIINSLASRYDNITVYFFDDSGSGAAGRPRNKGMEICREAWLAFNDPDDQIIEDAYLELLSAIPHENTFDIISVRGFYPAFQHGVCRIPPIYKENEGCIEYNEAFDSIEISSALQIGRLFCNAHSSIINTEFIRSNELSFIEGSYSEDNLLLLQILKLSPRIKSLPIRKLIYFAENEGSATNSDSIKKHLSRWIPGTNKVFRFMEGMHEVYYAPRNVIQEAQSPDDITYSLEMFEKLYEGTGKTIFDVKEEWLLAFLRENYEAEQRQSEYLKLLGSTEP